MRIVKASEITRAVAKLCIDANIYLPEDVKDALKKAQVSEKDDIAQNILGIINENHTLAREEGMPICQDTGMAVVFVEIGSEVYIEGNIEKAVNDGVREGYEKGFLRKSIVSDPLERKNTGDNTPAVIHYSFTEGDKVNIIVAPKGFGSENMSRLKMLNPSDGEKGVEDFVVETVKKAGANPCPPIVVGVGIGGNFELCPLLAKKALLTPLHTPNPVKKYAELETQLLERINNSNIGPQGFGGRTTALAVKIKAHPTHIAGLPVAVNINCHVARHCQLLV